MESPKRHRVKEELRTEKERFQMLSEHAPFGMVMIDKDGTFKYINPKFRELFGYELNDIPNGKTWFRKAYPDPTYRHHVISAWVDDLKSSNPGERRPGVFTATCKDGTKKVINFIPVQLETGENLMTCEDITERMYAEEALRKSEEEAKQLVRENAIMAEIGQIISSTLNIEEIYERFAEGVNKLIPFDRIAINIINPKDQILTIAYVTGIEIEGRKTGDTIPLAGTMTEEVIRKRSTLLIQTNGKEELARRFPRLLPTIQAKFKSLLSAPLFSKDQVIGVLHIRSTKLNAYSEKDLRLVERICNQIAGAIANAQLYVERKRAEEVLREYQKAVESSQDMIAVIDRNYNYLIANNMFLKYRGLDKEQVVGRSVSEVLGKDVFERVVKKNLDTCFRGEVVQYEMKYTYPESGERDLSVSYFPIEGPDGVNRVASVIRDITERKRAEEVLRESEEKFRDLYDNAPLGYHEYDKEGLITKVNHTDIEMLGYTAEEMIGQPIWKLNVGEEIVREQVLAKLAGTLPPGKELERTYRRKDGTTFPVLIEDRLILDEKGRIKGIRCTIQDITERKRAEEVLRESEEKFQKLFNEAPVGYMDFDREGRITQVIRTELTMLGYTAEEMLGQPLWKFIVEEEAAHQTIKAKLSGSIQCGEPFERNYRRKDGTTLPVVIEDALIRDAEGRITGIHSTIRDVTELKRAEEEKAALQEQLRQSQKMEAIGQLAGGIAHDFNNLLTIIKGYSQLSLIELKEGDPLKGNIEEIQKASQKAADLTHHLLAFSRRQVMEMKILDLNTLLKDLDKMLRRVIGEDIELLTLLADDLWRVKADPGQMEQVVMNLAVNARDAMPSGGRLTIETANVELDNAYARAHIGATPGRYVMLSVNDTGVGMTQEIKERAFDPFFTTKEKGKGTGLGLSTAYGIVKQSGGNIWVYSEPGRGTTFKIYLPVVDEPLDELREKIVGEELPHGSETVLVVEDEEKVRKLTVEILGGQGYRVLDASNGDDALVISEKHDGPIHLILVDVVMPGMSGSELAKRLASLRPQTKILYMSGYTDNAIIHHGVLVQGVNYIQKPFTIEGLTRKVREVLDKDSKPAG
jgi:two-component system cell cycle sensor histidine kinase/response regulator CckA